MTGPTLTTSRLEVRHPVEADRARFVELIGDPTFMVFSGGELTTVDANLRFDRMLAVCAGVVFAKEPIVERSSNRIIGYTGVDWIDFEDGRWLEWGYRLVTDARGRGYATEASAALLDLARDHHAGDVLGIIHPGNEPSHATIRALGFEYWKRGPVHGETRDLYRIEL